MRDETTLPGVVLSVWGPDTQQVFIAGGPLGNSGSSALAMHYDGATWNDLSPGGAATFWWVSGSSAKDVWFVGEEGRIAHYDGSLLSDVASPVTAKLWGAMSFSPDDAWAVGGVPGADAGAFTDVVLHWDGKAWTLEPLPGTALGVALFKVWGTSSDDLYVVGEHGTIWHRTKGGWSFEGGAPPLTPGRLLTVSGCGPDDIYTVGDQTVLHRDAKGWSKVDIDLSNVVNGVACGPAGRAVVVGNGGLKQRLVDGTWIDEFAIAPYGDFHGAWADGSGVFWIVGGDFQTSAQAGKRKGMVARFIPDPAGESAP